jgi:hypothetical protein
MVVMKQCQNLNCGKSHTLEIIIKQTQLVLMFNQVKIKLINTIKR